MSYKPNPFGLKDPTGAMPEYPSSKSKNFNFSCDLIFFAFSDLSATFAYPSRLAGLSPVK